VAPGLVVLVQLPYFYFVFKNKIAPVYFQRPTWKDGKLKKLKAVITEADFGFLMIACLAGCIIIRTPWFALAFCDDC